MKIFIRFFAYCLLPTACCCVSSCSSDTTIDDNNNNTTTNNVPSIPPAPKFNEDSAFAFIKAQVDFGPRVPGTTPHAKCAEYFVSKFKSLGWDVIVQNGNVTTYDGKKFNLKNIIASYKPEITNRILLLAHWDTRPWADQDSINKDKPIDGADDGASGPGVLLEIARQLSVSNAEIGIDILLDDLEDWGKENSKEENTWCLGTQYWSKNPHKPGYKAQYGILLDMVGAKNATFLREGLSREYAPYIVKKIWNKAAHLGYSNYFVFEDAGSITDDHFYVITNANIPCVDIINMTPPNQFGSHHHRHSDNMNIIDKNTLKAVGQTVLEVLWEEQKKSPS
ncbi:MAG TPA: M28 family peptidase [Chryseolinea sp.]|nr:M28 family peptidase [Chryseolinea sp.]